MRIGIDLHNLSTVPHKIVRTGIQQVVFNILEAQHWFRANPADSLVLLNNLNSQIPEIVPLPYLPLSVDITTCHKNVYPTHVNCSPEVLSQTARELGESVNTLFGSKLENLDCKDETRFYEEASSLDWIIITGLCEFRHVIERIKQTNPRIKVAVLVYDLIPLVQPHLTVAGMPQWFRHSYIESIVHFADLIFTISNTTALDVNKFLSHRLPPHVSIVSTVLPPEVPEIRYQSPEPFLETVAKHSLKVGQYFICLGTIEPRKNLILAIDGFMRFLAEYPESSGFKLVIIGKQGWSEEDKNLLSKIAGFKDSFYFPGYLGRDEIEMLICCANALVMPSRYEGFGMPLSLAHQLGVPTISAINSSLPEATELNSIFVNVNNPTEMALAMRALSSQVTSDIGFRLKDIQDIRCQWRKLFCSWISQVLAFQVQRSNTQNARSVARLKASKPKIIFDVHNLSINPFFLQKTGIQEVTHSILREVANLRKAYSDCVDLVCLPVIPDSDFSYNYATTCTCDKSIFQVIEKEFGANSQELWGFDFRSVNYSLEKDHFLRIVENADWFVILSQYDFRRSYSLLKKASPSVKFSTLVYDIIPTLYPHFVGADLRKWFTSEFLRTVFYDSDIVIGISRSATLDFLEMNSFGEFHGDALSLLLPTHQSRVLDVAGTEENASVLKRYSLKNQFYFVVVGSTDPRKNTAILIKSYIIFSRLFPDLAAHFPLCIVGPKVWRTNDIKDAQHEASKLGLKIIETGYLSDDELHTVIRSSRALYMPSKYEGFGVPLALAKSYGIPTVTCRNSSLPEATELNTTFVDPNNSDEIALSYLFHARSKNQSFENFSHNDQSSPTWNWREYVKQLIGIHLERINKV